MPHNAAAKMLCVRHPVTPQSSVSNTIMERLPVYAKRPCITAQLSSTSMLPAGRGTAHLRTLLLQPDLKTVPRVDRGHHLWCCLQSTLNMAQAANETVLGMWIARGLHEPKPFDSTQRVHQIFMTSKAHLTSHLAFSIAEQVSSSIGSPLP